MRNYAGLEVIKTARRVENGSTLGPDPQGHGVDGEVAPLEIVFDSTGRYAAAGFPVWDNAPFGR